MSYPQSVYKLLELIERCIHDFKWSDIPDDLRDALQIARHHGLVETNTVKCDDHWEAVAFDSVEAVERISTSVNSNNPTYWLSSAGRCELALYREAKREDSITDVGSETADQAQSTDCPPEWVPHLDELVTRAQVAEMVYLQPKSLKSHHTQNWPPPEIKANPKGGQDADKWRLRSLVPHLRETFAEKFEGKLRPPLPPTKKKKKD